jgi:hypothetical protein
MLSLWKPLSPVCLGTSQSWVTQAEALSLSPAAAASQNVRNVRRGLHQMLARHSHVLARHSQAAREISQQDPPGWDLGSQPRLSPLKSAKGRRGPNLSPGPY